MFLRVTEVYRRFIPGQGYEEHERPVYVSLEHIQYVRLFEGDGDEDDVRAAKTVLVMGDDEIPVKEEMEGLMHAVGYLSLHETQ